MLSVIRTIASSLVERTCRVRACWVAIADAGLSIARNMGLMRAHAERRATELRAAAAAEAKRLAEALEWSPPPDEEAEAQRYREMDARRNAEALQPMIKKLVDELTLNPMHGSLLRNHDDENLYFLDGRVLHVSVDVDLQEMHLTMKTSKQLDLPQKFALQGNVVEAVRAVFSRQDEVRQAVKALTPAYQALDFKLFGRLEFGQLLSSDNCEMLMIAVNDDHSIEMGWAVLLSDTNEWSEPKWHRFQDAKEAAKDLAAELEYREQQREVIHPPDIAIAPDTPDTGMKV